MSFSSTPNNTSGAVFNNSGYNWALPTIDKPTPSTSLVSPVTLNPANYVNPNVRPPVTDPRAAMVYQPVSTNTSTYDWSTNGDQTPLIKQGSIIPAFDVDAFVAKMLSPQIQAADAGTTPGLFVPQQAMGANK